MADAVSWAGAWPLLVVFAGAAATYFWRGLGVALSGRIRPDGALFDLFGCVAYALLAGLVVRMILLPTGPLQATGLGARIAATAVGVAVFFALRRSVLAGVVAGGASLAAFAHLQP
jgi:branched-subunit amino acid transport protein